MCFSSVDITKVEWKTLDTTEVVTGLGFFEGNTPREEDKEEIKGMNGSSCEVCWKPAELQKQEESLSPWASINDSLATC